MLRSHRTSLGSQLGYRVLFDRLLVELSDFLLEMYIELLALYSSIFSDYISISKFENQFV